MGGFAGAAAGLAAAGVAGAVGGFGGTGEGEDTGGVSTGALGSDCTEPEAVAFTPPGTAGLSVVGFGSPSGDGEEGELISSGIRCEDANL